MNTQDHSIRQDLPSIIQVIEEIYFRIGSERSRDGFLMKVRFICKTITKMLISRLSVLKKARNAPYFSPIIT